VARQLNAVSPLATLQRGYTVLRRDADGRVVTQAKQVTPGDGLEGLLADGRLALRVERILPAGRLGETDGNDE